MDWYDTEFPNWLGPNWEREVTSWVDDVLADGGEHRTGPVERVHFRLWSAVCRVETSRGMLYFKSAPPGMAFEPALLRHLRERGFPSLVVVADDLDRQWLLAQGESATVRDVYGPTPDALEPWKRLLTRYARMQLALAPDADMLVAAGVPDLRAGRLRAQFDLLVGCGHLGCGDDGLTPSEQRRLASLPPRVEALSEELAALGIPETLQHNDLHDSNVFVRGDELIVFDWGDASIANPLFDCEVMFAVGKGRFRLEPGVEGFEAFRDAYLVPFAEHTSMQRVLRALEVSVPLAKLCRAMTWHRIVDLPSGEPARPIVARRAKQLLFLLTGDPSIQVGPSPYL